MTEKVIARKAELGTVMEKEEKYSSEHWIGITIEEDPEVFHSRNVGSIKYETKQVLLVKEQFKIEVEFQVTSRDKYDFDLKISIPFRSEKSAELLSLLEFYLDTERGDLRAQDLGKDLKEKIRSETSNFVYSCEAEYLQYKQPEEELRDALTVPLDKFSARRGMEFTPTRFNAKFWSEVFSREEKVEKLKKRKLEREEFEQLMYLAFAENELEKAKKIDKKIQEMDIGDWYEDYLNQLEKVEDGHPLNASIRTLKRKNPSAGANFTESLGERRTLSLLLAAGNSAYMWYPENRGFNKLVTKDDLNGIRSVRILPRESEILIALGHRKGVSTLKWEHRIREANDFTVPFEAASESGFNSVAICNGKLYASNSRSGLFEWKLDCPDCEPKNVLEEKTKLHSPRARAVKQISQTSIAFLSGSSVFIYNSENGNYERFTAESHRDSRSFEGFVDFSFDESTSTVEALDLSGTVIIWNIENNRVLEKHQLHTGKRVNTFKELEILKREYYLLGLGQPYCPVYPKDNPSICITSYKNPNEDIYFTDGRSDYLFGLNKYGSRLYVWNIEEGGGNPDWVEEIKSRFGHGINDLTIIDSASPLASRLTG